MIMRDTLLEVSAAYTEDGMGGRAHSVFSSNKAIKCKISKIKDVDFITIYGVGSDGILAAVSRDELLKSKIYELNKRYFKVVDANLRGTLYYSTLVEIKQ